ncbi:phage tail protein [Roseovarius sp.]|uniref:phage tail protein n=1 Tax=Roseovarius sp. TaxID=1486281 RepID=UPI00356AE902
MFRKTKAAMSAGAIVAGITLAGTTTPARAGPEPFIGEIMMVGYTFCPRSWAEANGQLIPISNNTALFSLFGTTFGGDGRTTFALPDLRGRVPMHVGQGPGLSSRALGEKGGSETNTLTANQLPAHSHSLNGTTAAANAVDPSGNVLANTGRSDTYTSSAPNAQMNGGAIGPTGGGQAVNNMQPSLTIRYCVALNGIYPSRN